MIACWVMVAAVKVTVCVILNLFYGTHKGFFLLLFLDLTPTRSLRAGVSGCFLLIISPMEFIICKISWEWQARHRKGKTPEPTPQALLDRRAFWRGYKGKSSAIDTLCKDYGICKSKCYTGMVYFTTLERIIRRPAPRFFSRCGVLVRINK